MRGRDQAETVALEALGWMAGAGDLLGGFLAASGIAPGELRARAGDPDLLAAVLDHLLTEDAWVAGFCAATGHRPDALQRARALLPGGAAPHWT
ncbi:MAG: DUF3572 family protein [Rhodobacteraceae bacterium]|jgi:hypothetical protein|nr:DUF3572 family protein [Paracoccaceae bacterium]